jgi:hypothetical protein
MPSNNAPKFIPDKAPVSSESGMVGSGGGLGDILMLIAIILLASSLAIAAGVFLYASYINKSLADKQQSLERVRDSFDKKTIEDLKLLDAQLRAAKDVLQKHSAVSELFKALEVLTLRSVQLTNFTYRVDSDNSIKLEMDGKALTVNAVALQSKILGANRHVIQNPIFSNLDLEDDGVSFNIRAEVNPDFVNFSNVVLKRMNEGVIDNQAQADQEIKKQETDEFGNVIQ